MEEHVLGAELSVPKSNCEMPPFFSGINCCYVVVVVVVFSGQKGSGKER
jgi:hypothetical protein